MKSVTMIASATLLSVLFIYLPWPEAEMIESTSEKEVLKVELPSSDSVLKAISLSSETAFIKPIQNGEDVTSDAILIDPTKDNFVYGKKGTGLFFPAYSFLDESGNDVTKEVEIQVDEYYDIPEIIQANLTTTSDGRLIETAGMLNVHAYSAGKAISLNKQASYEIYFPKKGSTKKGFQLFYGDILSSGDINWKLAPSQAEQGNAEQGVSIAENSLPEGLTDMYQDELQMEVKPPAYKSLLNDEDNCFLQICESYLRRGTKVSEMDFFNWQLTNGQTLNQWFVANFNPDLEMLDRFCILGMRSEITFKVDRDGGFESYYISESSDPIYDRKIADFLSTMPSLDLSQLMPVYTADHSCILTFGGKESGNQDEFAAAIRKKFSDNPDAKVSGVNASTLDYFVFASSELGWINCDRFLYDESVLVDFSVQNKSAQNGSVNLIFDDINSVVKGVVQGDVVTFYGVPADKEVRLVALDQIDNKPLMCVKSSNTSSKTTVLTSYKPFTIKELEYEFAKRKN